MTSCLVFPFLSLHHYSNTALCVDRELKREGETASSQLATTLRADYRIFRDQRTVMTKRWKAVSVPRC